MIRTTTVITCDRCKSVLKEIRFSVSLHDNDKQVPATYTMHLCHTCGTLMADEFERWSGLVVVR